MTQGNPKTGHWRSDRHATQWDRVFSPQIVIVSLLFAVSPLGLFCRRAKMTVLESKPRFLSSETATPLQL